MLISRRKIFLIACAALLGGITDAQAAEWLNFYPISGDLSFGFKGTQRKGDTGESTRVLEYEEKLRLRLSGYSLDPGFFTFGVNLEPTLRQTETDSGSETVDSDSNYLNYGARFSLLHGVPESPVSLSANFSANTGETENSLGNWTDLTAETRGADLNWKFNPFKSTLSYRDRSINETFSSGFGQPPTERDEFQRTLTYKGKSSKMELYLEDDELDDRTADDRDYESQLARLKNNFFWGKGSGLTSQLEYSNREGFSTEEKISVRESIRLQHKRNLFTTYGYNYDLWHRTTDTETHHGKFGLNHQLYKNLTTNFRLGGTTVQSDQYQEKSYNAGLDFYYTKNIRPDLRLSASLGGGYNTTDRTGGQLDFTELPTVPPTRIVVLAQRYILWPTIIVAAPGCSPCQEGPHYLVADAGGDFTQLEIPLGSPINAGDQITVDYAYQPPTVEYYGVPYSVSVRLDYRAFALYHRTRGEDQTYESGPDPTAVGDSRTDTTGLEWNWTRGRNRASASAERVYISNFARSPTTKYRLRQSLKYAIAPNATLFAGLGESFVKDGTNVDVYTGELSVAWIPTPGLSVTPRLSAFRRTEDPGGTSSFVKAGVDVNWRWRRIVADLRYDHSQYDTNGRGRTDDRVYVKLTRKF
jgi:hypothetical protein